MSEGKMTFEQALDRLKGIVRALEKGDAPLADSLALYEEGIKLVRVCNGFLENAEQKVVELREMPNGEIVEKPFVGVQ